MLPIHLLLNGLVSLTVLLLFKSLDKASLTSCGHSLHSPYDTNGLIVLDGDAEKLLSPLLIDNVSIQCARGLSRDFYRTTTDRVAFA